MKIKTVLTLLPFLLATQCFALTAEEIVAIAEEPHSRENLIPELKIYPDARKYHATIGGNRPGEEFRTILRIEVREKVVRGKYVVSRYTLPDWGDATMIVTYDADAEVFRKWLLLPDGSITIQTGIGDLEPRIIAWESKPRIKDGKVQTNLSYEIHTDEITRFSSIDFSDGEISFTVKGIARKIE